MIICHGSNVIVEQPKIMQYDQMLSIYEFDIEAAQRDLAIIHFDEPNGDWLDFVCANRSGREAANHYDVVLGAVADDKVYTVVQFYENGIYDKADAIKRLKVEDLFNQILFHTEKSLTYCRFVGYEQLGGAK